MKRSHQVACYVNDEELAQLKAQVAKRGVTLSRYLKERALGGDDQTGPRPQIVTSDSENCAFEALLNESERRIAQQVATVTDKSASNAPFCGSVVPVWGHGSGWSLPSARSFRYRESVTPRFATCAFNCASSSSFT